MKVYVLTGVDSGLLAEETHGDNIDTVLNAGTVFETLEKAKAYTQEDVNERWVEYELDEAGTVPSPKAEWEGVGDVECGQEPTAWQWFCEELDTYFMIREEEVR